MTSSLPGKKRVVRRVSRHGADMPPAWAGRRAAALLAKRITTLATVCTLAFPAAAQDVMRGHGGPVRALAINGATRELVSGSFDSTVIVWDLDRGVAKRVLRFHEGPVNAVALLDGGCMVSGGEDRRVAIWCGDETKPRLVLAGLAAPVTAIASAGGDVIAGAMDGQLRAWNATTGEPRTARGGSPVLHQHKGALTAVAAGSGVVASSGGDSAIKLFAVHVDDQIQFPSPATALAIAADGLVAACADGMLRVIGSGRSITEIEVESIPLTSLALSPDGKLIATAGLRGGIAIIDRESRKVLHRLTGPGLPVWSLVFDADNRTLISGGADRVIRKWDAIAGKAITSNLPEHDVVAEAVKSGERGAVVFRACQACHTLSLDDGNRAGPTLYGIMGRRIGTAPGYAYSQALPSLPIVWTSETIARLFEVGPNAFTPGTKMPEQTITDPADRAALVEWLARVTAVK